MTKPLQQRTVCVGGLSIANDRPFTLISGPCQIESLGHAVDVAGQLKAIASECGVGFVFKSSFDKANRTSLHAKRGPGMDRGLAILMEVGSQIGCPTLTDVHVPSQCAETADAVDILQIPAFLCPAN